MKNVMFVVVACLIVIFNARAQESSDEGIRKYVSELKKSLNLNAAQYNKVFTIYKSASEKLDSWQSNKEQVEKKRSELSFEIGIQLLDVLSPYQWRDWMNIKDKLAKPTANIP
jgi:hypothetical protein